MLDTQVALHSTRPSRRLDYAGVMAFCPANPKEPSCSLGGTVSGGNMTFSRTHPFMIIGKSGVQIGR
jgi:hypothetical protein